VLLLLEKLQKEISVRMESFFPPNDSWNMLEDYMFVLYVYLTVCCFVNKAQCNGEFAKKLLLKDEAANCIKPQTNRT